MAGSGLWAVLDQGTFALSNFVLNVLLVRWLGAAEYGLFSVVFASFLLAGTVHTAVFTEPLLVFGSGRHRTRLRSYLGDVLRLHVRFSAVALLVLAVSGAVLREVVAPALGNAVIAVALATPFVLLQWMLRRACYIEGHPSVAAGAGVVYLVVMLAGATALRSVNALDAATALLLMGVASAVATLVLFVYVQTRRDDGGAGASCPSIDSVLAEHWRFGRWSIGSLALGWFAFESLHLWLSALHGLEATAALRAAMNLTAPASQVFLALGSVTLPLLVAARSRGALTRAARLTALAFVAMGAGYAVALTLGAEILVPLLYGVGDPAVLAVVPILALAVPFAAVIRVAVVVLYALEDPRAVFRAYIPGAAVTAFIGVGLTGYAGSVGAALATVLVTLVIAATVGGRVRMRLRESAVTR